MTLSPPIDWYVDILGTGCVAAVAPDDDFADVTAALAARYGADPGENEDEYGLLRDYGLVEAYWQRPSRRAPWRGTGFMVQTHRLDCPPDTAPPPFAAIEAAVRALGVELTAVPRRHEDGCADLVAPNGVNLLVQREPQEDAQPVGTVVKIHVPPHRAARTTLGPLPEADWQALRQSTKALAAEGDPDRRRWLDRHAQDDPAWWDRRLWGVESAWLSGALAPGAAAELAYWLLDRADERTVFPHADAVLRRARLAADLISHHFGEQVVDPAVVADTARRCVEVLPLTPVQAAALPASWRDRTPSQRADARLARVLLGLAAELAPGAAHLDQWTVLRSGLSGTSDHGENT
ncbi:hypothetical protein Cs7R123_72770 [Catellatospora sp. TT07R-123]|uniref:hypothetical protein n=1 Tax=Catellatospora sp. TT07R-123 TaxID=2733863 RepID=UPI001B0F625C|nr:hypothetical protein [Catellatospora sp. TT07R-123]GHJ49935.1 hypothetical protein Cs7R123_72770 [Catellatospora sp. TT07R-123]